jgi:hypothetical protein
MPNWNLFIKVDPTDPNNGGDEFRELVFFSYEDFCSFFRTREENYNVVQLIGDENYTINVITEFVDNYINTVIIPEQNIWDDSLNPLKLKFTDQPEFMHGRKISVLIISQSLHPVKIEILSTSPLYMKDGINYFTINNDPVELSICSYFKDRDTNSDKIRFIDIIKRDPVI